MQIDTWLSQLSERMGEVQQRSQQLAETVASATGTATSPDRSVTVEVGANGGLQRIEFGRDIENRTPTQLGELVMKTVRAAQRSASEKVTDALAEFGGDGELLRRYVNYQPPPDAEELRELDRDPQTANADFGVADDGEPEPAAPPGPHTPEPQRPASFAPARPRPADEPDDEEEIDPW